MKKSTKIVISMIAIIAVIAVVTGIYLISKPTSGPEVTPTVTPIVEATVSPIDNPTPTIGTLPTETPAPTKELTPTMIPQETATPVPHEHVWEAKELPTTCFTDGKTWEECTCGEIQKEVVVPTAGHGALTYHVVTEPTVETEGTYEEVCEACETVVTVGTLEKLMPTPTPTPKPTNTPTPKPTKKPTPTPKPAAKLVGSFDDITIKGYDDTNVIFTVEGNVKDFEVECEVTKPNIADATLTKSTDENGYELNIIPLNNGFTSVKLYLYGKDNKDNRLLYDTVGFTVKVKVTEEETPADDVWYAKYIKDYPCKISEWQYGDNVYVSLWSQYGKRPEGTKLGEWGHGEDKAILIVDGTGNMWTQKEAAALGVYPDGIGNADYPWKDTDYSNYTQQTYEVHIAEGITHIEELGMVKLTHIEFPSTLKSVGQGCFDGTDIAEIILPEGLERIEDRAFYRMPELTTLQLPSTLKYIGEWAFGLGSYSKENHLKKLVLPNGIEYIGCAAFIHRTDIELIVPEGLDTDKFDKDWDTIEF